MLARNPQPWHKVWRRAIDQAFGTRSVYIRPTGEDRAKALDLLPVDR
jgi:hypothetical protein